MHLDFHYDVIYVLARYAQFTRNEAEVIAYSSQYVDDGSLGGLIKFSNAPAYCYTRSVIDVISAVNLDESAQNMVWLPLHFLPGNDPAGLSGSDYAYIGRLICRANSLIAREMVAECIRQKHKSLQGLQRLGITLHAYADTWAHQGFAGILHDINELAELRDAESGDNLIKVWISKLDNAWDSFLMKNYDRFPLGHLAALQCPDIPYLVWTYTNRYGYSPGIINNIDRFMEAVEYLWIALKRYRLGNPEATVETIPGAVYDVIKDLLLNRTRFPHENDRHAVWQKALAEDEFGFGDGAVPYIAHGPGSWRSIALNQEDMINNGELFLWSKDFAASNWRKFHDSVKEHVDFVINKLLPKHGVIIV